MSINQSMLVLTQEPFIGYMPKDICELLYDEMPEDRLALIFAHVANKTGILFSELGEGDEWVSYSYYEWKEVHEKVMDVIFAVLIKEGSVMQIPATGKYYALMPFMERNGYCCPSGWWISRET